MGIFSRKTDEQKQADLQAKLDKASRKIDREEKFTDRERGQFDKATMKHKTALAKRGVDAREATGIIWTDKDNHWVYMATMPDVVAIYTVKPFGAVDKLKETDTIPYSSINSVQFDKGTFTNTITLVTSGKTYVMETMEHGRFIVDYINAQR